MPRRTMKPLLRMSRVKMEEKKLKRNRMKSSQLLPLKILPSADFAGTTSSQLIIHFYRSVSAVEVSSLSISSVLGDG